MRGRNWDRREMLRLGAGLLALSATGRAQAEGSPADDPKLRFVDLPPLLLPGKEKFAFIRISLRLVVRKTEKIVEENGLVLAYKPRIIGLLTEDLPEYDRLSRSSDPTDLTALKTHVRELSNSIIGKPIIEDVLILSFLTG